MKDRGFSQIKKGYWLIKVKYPCKNFAYHHLHKVVFELHHGKFFSFEIETENNARQLMHVSHFCHNKNCFNVKIWPFYLIFICPTWP